MPDGTFSMLSGDGNGHLTAVRADDENERWKPIGDNRAHVHTPGWAPLQAGGSSSIAIIATRGAPGSNARPAA